MDLTEIVIPPKNPVYNGLPEVWPSIEKLLGMKLPDDFKRMTNIYGAGSFLEFIYLDSPFAPFDTAFNMFSGKREQILSSYDEGQKEFPQYTAPFPASDLFPWATTPNGDTLFWLTQGNPNDWTVVVCDSKFSKKHDHFNLNTIDFLCQLMLRKLKSKVFPRDLLEGDLRFVPYSQVRS